MKWIGIILLVAAGSGLGIYYARRQLSRVRFWERLGQVLEALQTQMTYTTRPLAELWRDMDKSGAFADFSLVKSVSGLLEEYTFSDAFSAALTHAELTQQERETLLTYAGGCGVTGLKEQIAHLESFREIARCFREEAARQALPKAQIYPTVGLAGGVALAMLIL